jgi:hypothetical protein
MELDLSTYSFDPIAVNIVSAWVIQQVKMSDWRIFGWITEQTPKVNVAVAACTAALTAAGMAVDWQSGTGTLTISGISLNSALLFAWGVVKGYAFQHVTYQAALKPKG